MSYDISFKVKVEGVNAYVEVGDCDANITWNVRKIIELSTGLPWRNCENNGLCVDVIPKIEQGLKELRTHPEKYTPYEASNGWGTVSGTAHFFWLDGAPVCKIKRKDFGLPWPVKDGGDDE